MSEVLFKVALDCAMLTLKVSMETIHVRKRLNNISLRVLVIKITKKPSLVNAGRRMELWKRGGFNYSCAGGMLNDDLFIVVFLVVQ